MNRADELTPTPPVLRLAKRVFPALCPVKWVQETVGEVHMRLSIQGFWEPLVEHVSRERRPLGIISISAIFD